MHRVLIWDLPTRLFHWLLAAGFVIAAVISLVLGEDGPLFPYHAIIGLTIAMMVCLRLIWGVVGTRYARFDSFVFGPRAVVEYMKGTMVGGGKRHIGHNPGSACAIFAILGLVLTLAVTGVMMAQGNESVEEVHEIAAYAAVGVVIVHVLGVAFHTLRHRENITASMIHGRKSAEASEGIRSSRPMVAGVFLVIAGAWAFELVRNYDSATQATTVPLLGAPLQLGENEGGGESESRNDED